MQIEVKRKLLNECNQYRPGVIEMIERICKNMDIKEDKIEKITNSARFIDDIFQMQNKSIVAVPCGGGKTLWSTGYIIYCYEQWERPELTEDEMPNDLMVIVDTVKTAEERIEQLKKLGVKKEYIGFYHSFNEEECKRLSGKELTFKEISKPDNKHICRDCLARNECKYCSRNIELSKKIVFACHEGFCRLHEAERIPKGKDIIIDEEIKNFFHDTIKKPELEAFLKHVPDDEGSDAIVEIKNVIRSLLEVINNSDKRKCTLKWNMQIKNDTKVQALKDIYDASQSSEDMDLDLYSDHYRDLIYKLGYSLREGFRNYVWAEKQEVAIGRDRINFNIDNRVIMLNGSAQLERNIYEHPEMKIWVCDDINETYQNVTLHCLRMNPTKKQLLDRDNITELMEYAREVFRKIPGHEFELGGIFFAVNKVNDEMEQVIEELFPNTQDKDKGHRGTIIGSNNWRDYDNGILGSSSFTNLASYALSASLRNNKEYSREEIFAKRQNEEEGVWWCPRFTRDFHIVNKDIDDEFQRQAVYELHQHILRLSCRHQSQDPVHVVLLIPNIEMIRLLHDLMEGFKVNSPDGMLRLANHLLKSKQPILNDKIYDLFELSKAGKNREKIKKIMDSYGWTLTQLKDGKKGNRKVWVKEIKDADEMSDEEMQLLGLDGED